MQMELPVRKKIRLEGYDYSGAGCYFITICIKDGHEILGKVVVGDAALGVPFVVLNEIGEYVKQRIEHINVIPGHIRVDKYVIMPNHIHLLLSVTSGTPRAASPTKSEIAKAVNAIKSLTTKHIGYSIWQRSYNDRIIRDEEEYQSKWRYIEENPARWTEDEFYKVAL